MTTYVETDFVLALIKESDWPKEQAEQALDEYDLVTAPYTYLELLLIHERHEYDYTALISNMLELVPVNSDEDHQVVLKAVRYFEEGMTAFDAFHAATAEGHGYRILGSDSAYDDIDVERIPLEPDG